MITNKKYYVDLAKLSDKKILYEFAKEMFFDATDPGKNSTRDRTLIKLLEASGLRVSSSRISNINFFI